jgi:Protein  of unknown function (DUF3018)
MASKALSSNEKVQNFRARQRAKGLKLVQFWVPDVTTAEFRAEAKRQCLLANASAHAAEEQAWVDSMIDMESWPAWDPKEA